MHSFGFLAVCTHTHTQNVHKLYGQKFEATQEAEKERENDAAAAEKTKIIPKLKLKELEWGVVCCCCVVELNLPRFFSILMQHKTEACPANL